MQQMSTKITNILAAGADPQDFGFMLSPSTALDLLKESVPKQLKLTGN